MYLKWRGGATAGDGGKAGGLWRVVEGDGRVVAARVRLAGTPWARLRGLLGRRLAADEGLWLTPCNAIHTCFLRHPIDAVFLARDGQVLAVETVAPWRMRVVPGARQVLELPPGAAVRCGLRPGGRLRLEPP